MKKIFTIAIAALTAMTVSAEVLLNETVEFGTQWDTYRVINLSDAPCLANVQVGDIFTITVTAVDTESEGGPQLAIQSSSWVNLDEGFGLGFTEVGVYPFVLTEAAVAQVKGGGIIVKGINNTISKVELLYQKTLWTGELQALDNWQQTDALDKSIFAGLKAGDLLGVAVSEINPGDWHLYALRANYETNIIEHNMSNAGVGVDELSSEAVNSLQNDNIILVASYLTATAIYTYVPTKSVTPTAIENTAVQKTGVKVLRDGIMYIQRGENLYNMQGQIVK